MYPTKTLSGDDLAAAFTSNGEAWMVLSLAAVLPILWAFLLAMHFGRPYVIRFLRTLTLRFGGDVWWLSYVLIRDGLIVITLGLSTLFFFPNLYLVLGLPLTAPLATVVLMWALLVKYLWDADENPVAFRAVSLLLVIASVLYIVPQVYGLEAADQAYLSDVSKFLTSTENLAWARPIYWGSLVLFGLTGVALFLRFFLRIGRDTHPAPATLPSTPGQAGGEAVMAATSSR
jgi:hypothetical protein